MRGLGKLVKSGVLDRIVGKLVSEGLLTKQKGNWSSLCAGPEPSAARGAKVGAVLRVPSSSEDCRRYARNTSATINFLVLARVTEKVAGLSQNSAQDTYRASSRRKKYFNTTERARKPKHTS